MLTTAVGHVVTNNLNSASLSDNDNFGFFNNDNTWVTSYSFQDSNSPGCHAIDPLDYSLNGFANNNPLVYPVESLPNHNDIPLSFWFFYPTFSSESFYNNYSLNFHVGHSTYSNSRPGFPKLNSSSRVKSTTQFEPYILSPGFIVLWIFYSSNLNSVFLSRFYSQNYLTSTVNKLSNSSAQLNLMPVESLTSIFFTDYNTNSSVNKSSNEGLIGVANSAYNWKMSIR